MPASRSSLTALAVAVACSACSQGAAAASGSNGWSTHRDPAGFIVDVPPGWSLHYDATHRKVTLGGADGTRVVLRVVTENQALTQAEGAPVGEALAADAQKRRWVSWALEARLAELDVLSGAGETARWRALRQSLSADARRLGFLWVARRLPPAARRPNIA